MKKLFSTCIALIISLFIGIGIVGCKDTTKDTLNIYMPDGAPALAMSKLMYDKNDFGYDIDYTVVSASNISNCILQETADIAILPINMASKILKDGEKYKVVSTVTNGNLYIVGNKDISTINDLNNQVVGVFGQGNVPDLTFRYLLGSNGLSYADTESDEIENKVALKYYSDASNLIPLLKNNTLSFGLLAEPAVSKLLSMNSDFNIELDIQALWEGGSYPQAVMVVKTSLCDNITLINNILKAMEDGDTWILNNPSLAVDTINSNLDEGVVGSLQNTISSSAIANCNIDIRSTALDGEVDRMKSYLEKIRSVNSSAIGNYSDNLFCTL